MFINDIIHLFTAIYEMHICNAFIKKKSVYILASISTLNVGWINRSNYQHIQLNQFIIEQVRILFK